MLSPELFQRTFGFWCSVPEVGFPGFQGWKQSLEAPRWTACVSQTRQARSGDWIDRRPRPDGARLGLTASGSFLLTASESRSQRLKKARGPWSVHTAVQRRDEEGIAYCLAGAERTEGSETCPIRISKEPTDGRFSHFT